MCGIAGLIHRGKTSDIGSEMTSMLQSLKHRGPDSTGFALYGRGSGGNDNDDGGNQHVMRFKVAEQEEMRDIDIRVKMRARIDDVDARLEKLGVRVLDKAQPTEYSLRYAFAYDGDMRALAAQVEAVDSAEILSIGRALELIKDMGDAGTVAADYGIPGFTGTHAIGHTRMATESDVDIRSAHPYWAYPFNDISVVHNGQLTNYWTFRREMERIGHRFVSDCDSELIAVYIAERIQRGDDLEAAMHRSIDELDGVFTYLVATGDQLGMAKDVMAAKPMVLYESGDFIGLASEEVAIRSIFPNEIETWDPYEGEVKVWRA
ncbi:MAG: class II glutamine amidotransferase [Gammaproteobacteria bacterium]|nr:class II glutamine amidotransferase [Gammaproteobacteria bacterium]MDA7962007.1 class II glutamine amidotransferase [Gammaproteobacteria bacterium]MDA7968536.1 class II glutamine amidotransferase [Gammaproteobacteria bacterium]MDA7970441.1 class II glutamine amidotransferase [Gammaproteobacteria bacterium]MDA8011396.1 class II glutamine amidotransferase [Gammaproteobacteria bacterium]